MEIEFDKFTQAHGVSATDKENTLDVKSQEIRKLF